MEQLLKSRVDQYEVTHQRNWDSKALADKSKSECEQQKMKLAQAEEKNSILAEGQK